MNHPVSLAPPCRRRRRPVLAALLLAAVAFVPAPAAAGPSLGSRIAPLVRRHRGAVAVMVKHLGTGVTYALDEGEPMPTASLIKVAVMAAAYRQAAAGRLDLDSMLTLTDADKVPGSGILTANFSAGTRLSVRDAIHLMIAFSDNTATNLVLGRTGLEAVSAFMEELGLAETKIHSLVFRRETSVFPARSRVFGLGSTTAAEMVRLLELLHRRELVSREASEAMLAHLRACRDRSKIPRLLPAGIKVAHKSGAVSDARCDAGIIESPSGPIAICILTKDNEDRRWTDDNAADLLCARIAAAAYRFFNPAAPGADGGPAPRRVLSRGDSGLLVEHLQRTLNARLHPSPDLSIDGDFGPVTEAAVIRFQRSRGIEATGIVGPETWPVLGALVTRDAPVPDPEVVNARVLPRSPPDPLDGPPFVTCKAWCIGRASDGAVIAGGNDSRELDMASTTKIMTALVVLEEVKRSPELLESSVTFSRRADETPGSTAGIRFGESLPLIEALHGLLLPSGNDAAVALAEHVGARLRERPGPRRGSSAGRGDPLERFVLEMNRAARRLGLRETRYVNPHGLTAEGHHTSARDLVKLAAAALRFPLFRRIVSTRRHGCRVTGPGGYTRNVMWQNTNRLLAIEGYGGVKTGTTREAGACLVTLQRRAGGDVIGGGRGGEERALIAVVLGSTSSDARYVDTRNLLRWARSSRLVEAARPARETAGTAAGK